jgi:hypothetical protein
VLVTDRWEYGVQDPSGSLDYVYRVLDLQVDILDSLGAQVKAFALVGYSYCSIRLVDGLGQDGL